MIIVNSLQDAIGSNADSKNNPVILALPLLKQWFPDLLIACDVSLYFNGSHARYLKLPLHQNIGLG